MATETYQMLSGEVLRFERQGDEAMAFLARVRVAVGDPHVSENDLINLIYGEENPILRRGVIPGRGYVDREAWANPLYRIMTDLLAQKRLQAGTLDLEAAAARCTVPVSAAAERLGITPAAVRQAIGKRRLAAVKKNGQWWIAPRSLASYQVGTRGPRRRTMLAGEPPPAGYAAEE